MALEVPGALVPCVRETVVLQYRAAVESLQLAFAAQDQPGGSRAEVRCARRRLGQLDALVDELGWPGEPVAPAIEVSAPGRLLRDALHGALIDAGERLAVACEARWRDQANAAAVRAAAGEVIDLDRLLRRLERRG